MKTGNLPDKEFKVMIIKRLNKFSRIDEHNKKINRIRKYKEESNKTEKIITEIKIHKKYSKLD